MYNVILNPYNNIKSRIVYYDSVSNFFPCLNGVRQGEHLYSFLFALYLNDLDTFLTSKNAQGVKSISEDFENDLQIDVKLFTILYADDTVLLAVCCRIALRVELFLRILWEMELKSKHKQIQSHVFFKGEVTDKWIHILGYNVSKNRVFQEKLN